MGINFQRQKKRFVINMAAVYFYHPNETFVNNENKVN